MLECVAQTRVLGLRNLAYTRLVRSSQHVMVVWELYGHCTRYASAEIDGKVGTLVGSVER